MIDQYEQFRLPCMSELVVNSLRSKRGQITPSTMRSTDFVWICQAARVDLQQYEKHKTGILNSAREDRDPVQQATLYNYLRFVGFSHEEAEEWKVGQYK
jgi:hypothetical protein